MVRFGSLIIFVLFSMLTHHPISVHGTSETQDSNTTSATSSPPSRKSIPKYPFSVQLPGQSSSSDIETRRGTVADIRSQYSKCEDGRICGPACYDPKEIKLGGAEEEDAKRESTYCISGRCGLNKDDTPVCGIGKSSNCENGKVCDPNCEDARELRREIKYLWGTSEKYDIWKKEQQEVINEFKLGKFCKSGLCVIVDYAYVCGTIGLRQASISLPVIFLIPALLIAKTLI